MVEVLGDAVEVTAVELAAATRPRAGLHRVRPGRLDGPVGGLPLVGGGRAGEAVGEDLVDDGVQGPLRQGGVRGDDPEVRGVGDIPQVAPGPVDPQPPDRAAGEQPAVGRHRVATIHLGAPPHLPLGGAFGIAHGRDEVGFPITQNPHVCRVEGRFPGGGRARGNPQPQADDLTEARRLGRDVERRTVVVGPVQTDGRRADQPGGRPGDRQRRIEGRGHFTDPAVRPPMSWRWKER